MILFLTLFRSMYGVRRYAFWFLLNSFRGLRCPMFVYNNKLNIFMHMIRIHNFNTSTVVQRNIELIIFAFIIRFIELIFVHKVYAASLNVVGVSILCFCFIFSIFYIFYIFYPYFCCCWTFNILSFNHPIKQQLKISLFKIIINNNDSFVANFQIPKMQVFERFAGLINK